MLVFAYSPSEKFFLSKIFFFVLRAGVRIRKGYDKPLDTTNINHVAILTAKSLGLTPAEYQKAVTHTTPGNITGADSADACFAPQLITQVPDILKCTEKSHFLHQQPIFDILLGKRTQDVLKVVNPMRLSCETSYLTKHSWARNFKSKAPEINPFFYRAQTLFWNHMIDLFEVLRALLNFKFQQIITQGTPESDFDRTLREVFLDTWGHYHALLQDLVDLAPKDTPTKQIADFCQRMVNHYPPLRPGKPKLSTKVSRNPCMTDVAWKPSPKASNPNKRKPDTSLQNHTKKILNSLNNSTQRIMNNRPPRRRDRGRGRGDRGRRGRGRPNRGRPRQRGRGGYYDYPPPNYNQQYGYDDAYQQQNQYSYPPPQPPQIRGRGRGGLGRGRGGNQ